MRAIRDTQASGMLPEEMVVIARTGPLLNRIAGMLLAEGLPNSRIDGKCPRGVGIQLVSMHRAKGLEFRADINRRVLGRGAAAAVHGR